MDWPSRTCQQSAISWLIVADHQEQKKIKENRTKKSEGSGAYGLKNTFNLSYTKHDLHLLTREEFQKSSHTTASQPQTSSLGKLPAKSQPEEVKLVLTNVLSKR